MGELKVTCDPAEVGLDGERLRRIDAHFSAYVDGGRLPGWLVLVSRGGEIAYLSTYGARDIASGAPVETDTLFRMYSMTKPVTSVAAMMLYEEGRITLNDPVADYIPSFGDVRVYESGPASAPVTRPADEPVRIWHLLTHTAGLVYGWQRAGVVDELYRAAGLTQGIPDDDLAGFADRVAGLPLLFEPGSRWNYSVATDVLGRVIEVVSGMPFDRFLAERVFGPLGMSDTGFRVEEGKADRLASLYTTSLGGRAVPAAGGDAVLRPTRAPSGGAGLVSTAGDYHRFTQMLLRGGELDGMRLLGPRTLAYMTRNHLPGEADLKAYGATPFGEAVDGEGFGLGFAVVQDAARVKTIASEGEFHWGGAASTLFWVDPAEDITVVFLTQVTQHGVRPIRTRLRQLVHQAIVS
ncbi:serine hydrolase domain-containing protein [Thermopolyspora sp. NPDC052614]|uniref:serine hydrolase domain-containing protein n=1 Tax=Thermopolyspora sp. NPDC052614 TaxID=3155682 RepID=UPI00344208F5